MGSKTDFMPAENAKAGKMDEFRKWPKSKGYRGWGGIISDENENKKSTTELQKGKFCPVSRFSTTKCPQTIQVILPTN